MLPEGDPVLSLPRLSIGCHTLPHCNTALEMNLIFDLWLKGAWGQALSGCMNGVAWQFVLGDFSYWRATCEEKRTVKIRETKKPPLSTICQLRQPIKVRMPRKWFRGKYSKTLSSLKNSPPINHCLDEIPTGSVVSSSLNVLPVVNKNFPTWVFPNI